MKDATIPIMSVIKETFIKQKQHSAVLSQTKARERIEKLLKLRNAILKKNTQIKEAIYKDFKKSAPETDLTEIYTAIVEINHTVKHLKKWMRPQRVKNTLGLFGTRSELRYEAKGVVLIIAPWNYPFSMIVNPLISALAAGNAVILKPSEMTSNTSRFLKSFISEIFDEKEVAVFEGGPEVTQELLSLPFDHIFFTGSTKIGKIVMEAAAKNLTSVTLELGGKSPAIVDRSADLSSSAKKIIWGKLVNAGQTCVAPDYVLLPEEKLNDFVREARAAICEFYGPTENEWKNSKDLCRIVNDQHFNRLKKTFEEAVALGAKIEIGGVFDSEQRYISPTLVSEVLPTSSLMKEEIFGPLLPIVTFKDDSEIFQTIAKLGKPLALYIFSKDNLKIENALKLTSAGGTCINNTLVHLANPNLPFGGVGASGFGSYHGPYGFRAFSHERAVMRQGFYNSFKYFYPPYTQKVKNMIQFAMRFLAG